MQNLKLVVSYNGTAYQGWQEQKSGKTVEGAIKDALSRMHKEPITIQAAGRTDSGVHANGQVINFFSSLTQLSPERMVRAINNFLPKDIRVRQAIWVDDSFHARFDARIRTYKYYLLPSELPLTYGHDFSLRIVRKPLLPRLNSLARPFIGQHDFKGFCAPNEQVRDTVRTIYSASFAVEGPYVVFWISAPSFLWRMVRSLVGSILHYDELGMSEQDVRTILNQANRELAGPTAPAWGLFLHKVVYKDEPLVF